MKTQSETPGAAGKGIDSESVDTPGSVVVNCRLRHVICLTGLHFPPSGACDIELTHRVRRVTSLLTCRVRHFLCTPSLQAESAELTRRVRRLFTRRVRRAYTPCAARNATTYTPCAAGSVAAYTPSAACGFELTRRVRRFFY